MLKNSLRQSLSALPEWFHPLIFPFPPAPTCLFTRKDDTRPCLQVLRQLTLAEHRRAVADGRL